MARGKSSSSGYSSSGSGGKSRSSNPHMVDSSGPSDGLKSMNYNAADAGNYKSTENQKGATAGVKDTGSGSGPSGGKMDYKFSDVGNYQSGNNNRGGAATKNYDRPADKDCEYMAPGLEELRAKQDRASGHSKSDEND